MNELEAISSTLALTMGVAWASGINLYAAILVLGYLGLSGGIDLPTSLHILENPFVLGVAGILFLVEMFADKIPGIDSAWDIVQTFVRIPAGALLAAAAVGDVSPELTLAAGLLGGGVSAASHATKSGTRVLINTSPEPVSNWIASFTEDALVVGGLWTALNYPILFLALFLLATLLTIYLLPKIWRGIKGIFLRLKTFLSGQRKNLPEKPSAEKAEEAPEASAG